MIRHPIGTPTIPSGGVVDMFCFRSKVRWPVLS